MPLRLVNKILEFYKPDGQWVHLIGFVKCELDATPSGAQNVTLFANRMGSE